VYGFCAAREVILYLVQVTKGQVAEMLDSRGAELANNVEALLLAVKSTNDFEAEMARRFGGSTSEDTEHEVHPVMTCNAQRMLPIAKCKLGIFLMCLLFSRHEEVLHGPLSSAHAPCSMAMQISFG